MEILTPTTSDQLPEAFNKPSGNILRPAQMAEHYNDLRHAEADLQNPKVQDKGAVHQRVNNIKRQYESQAPRPITDGKLKDALVKELDGLVAKFTPGMLSKEEMRKNPPGATDKFLRHERMYKKDMIRAKKILSVLNADGSDPHTWDRDAANLEKYRPDGPQDRFRADAQITGKMTYGNVPDEKWAETFGKTNPETSALEQARRVAEESIGLTLPDPLPPVKTGRKPMSAEQRKIAAANLARGREARKQRLQQMLEKGV